MAVMKQQRIIREFKHYVNMTPDELEAWLKTEQSNSVGWTGSAGQESVGHRSGRRIVSILREEGGYSTEQMKHMQKVAGYCKRHLGQAAVNTNNKSPDEIKKSNFYASLKNWGHDYLRGVAEEGQSDTTGQEEDEDESVSQDESGYKSDESSPEDETDHHSGHKRQHSEVESDGPQEGDNKRPKTSSRGRGRERASRGRSSKGGSRNKQKDDSNDNNEGNNNDGDNSNGDNNGVNIEKGDTVSWPWGGGHPKGKVLDVKPDTASIMTKSGNRVNRNGTADDPAVALDAGRSKAIRLAHELD